jgi:Histidine kinase
MDTFFVRNRVELSVILPTPKLSFLFLYSILIHIFMGFLPTKNQIKQLIKVIYFLMICFEGKAALVNDTLQPTLKINSFKSKILGKDSTWILNQPISIPTQPSLVIVSFTDSSADDTYKCLVDNYESFYTKLDLGKSKIIYLANLQGGNYTITVTNVRTEQKAELKFSIASVFWQKWWFSPLVFLILGVILGAIFYIFYLIRLRQELRVQSIKYELEIKALRAQMNPHFIFNCMNTIDAYILRKRFMEASDYLQKFSKLIRRILENSESQTISIEQEIQTLKLYIELEQERFSDSFTYVLDIQSELQDSDYQIPSLVLQPFVENAILHGIRHLTERKGEVIIKMRKIEEQGKESILYCEVQDNGIGRKASGIINQQRQSNHKSMGVNVTIERIKTYQAIYGSKMETLVNDLNEGTRVEIKLPLILS